MDMGLAACQSPESFGLVNIWFACLLAGAAAASLHQRPLTSERGVWSRGGGLQLKARVAKLEAAAEGLSFGV